jgi:PAS domain S-box-containing protein
MSHLSPEPSSTPKLYIPLRIIALYVLFGSLWILLSDRLLAALVSDPGLLSRVQTLKGWFYVVVTAALLYELIRRDIIAMLRSEQALQENEERYRSLFENSIDAVLLTLPDGTILAANPAACRIFERTEEEMCRVGRSGLVDATDPHLPLALEEQACTGRLRGELTFKRKHGASFPGEVSSGIFQDRHGFDRTSMIIRDISQRKRAEFQREAALEALCESEERYCLIAAHVDDIVWQLDMNLQFVYVSPAVERVLGYSVEEALKMRVTEFLNQDGMAQMKQYIQTRLHSEQPARPNEYKMRHKDGHWVDLEVISSPIYDGEGRPVGFAGVTRDISARKQAEEHAREAEEKMRLYMAMFECSKEAIAISDPEGRLVYINSAHEKLFGRPLEAARQMDYREFYPPESVKVLDSHVAPALARGEGWEGELNALDATGRLFPLWERADSIFDSSGKLQYCFGFMHDITERTRVESQREAALEALRESEERFRRLAEAAFEGVLIHEEGLALSVNDQFCEMFGYEADELLGKQVIPLTVATEARGFMRKEITSGGLGPYESIGLRKDGTKFPMEIRSRETEHEGHRIRVAAVRDITERKRAEQEHERLFQEAQRAHEQLETLSRRLMDAQENDRRELARELHDEIGQVLTAVKTNLQAIRLSPEPETLQARLEESSDIVAQALEQIRALALDLRPSLLDDFGLVATIEWYLESQARRSGFRAEFHAEPPEMQLPPTLETTCFRVAQATLTNIERHARATEVQVTLRRTSETLENSEVSNTLELVVRDNGIGFDVPAALERAARGASLGLPGMRERVRLAGGDIRVESAPSGGTEIRARFPIRDEKTFDI